MKCFLCNTSFERNDNLFKHLKEYHFLKTNDNYKCCGSTYKDTSTFKRHVRKKHADGGANTFVYSERSVSNTFEHSEPSVASSFPNNSESDSVNITSQNNVESATTSTAFESNVNVNIILQNFLEFQTAMHSKFNLTRKDVENINTNLIQLIVEPLLNMFCSYGKNLDPEFYMKIFNFSEECRSSLNSIKTEHLLKKKLMEGDLLEFCTEEVVETSEQMVHKKAQDQNDCTMQELLQLWNLAHLSELFNAENINIIVFKLMTENDLYELTAKMKFGDKIIFRHCFENWRAENNLPLSTFPNTTISQSASTSTLSLQQNSSDAQHKKNVTNVTVLEILRDHKTGLNIIENYKKVSKITEKERLVIIDIIVHYFHAKNLDMTLQVSHQLEKEIIQLFPTEKLDYYRTERRGKIYAKYHNKKQFSKTISTVSEGIQSDTQKSTKILETEENAEMYIHSIKYDNLSAEDFRSAWTACSKFRLQQIMKESQNIKEALSLWPQYKRTNGFQLIDIDFNVINKHGSTILDWNDKFKNLFELIGTSLKIRDPNIRDVFKSINKEEFEKDKDCNMLKILWCLHSHLYPTKKYVRNTVDGKKEFGRYTVKDSQESFIYINETMQSLNAHIDFLSTRGEPIQPFILGIGNPKTVVVQKYFLFLDGYLMSFNNFQRALDICFKSFHVFNVEYPAPSSPFWEFIQIYIYDMKQSNKSNSKVSILVDDLTKF